MVPARLGEKFVQLGLWAFSELGGGGELEERGRKGALSCDRQEPGPARNPAGNRGRSGCGRNSRRLMSREQAQELHGLGAKPAASLDADNDEAASPGAGEFRVGLMSLPARCSNDSTARLDISTRVGLAKPREGRHDNGIEGELGPVPEGETVRDNLDALQQAVMLSALALEVMGNESVVAERRSQHGETLTFGWEGPVSDPDRLVSVTSEVGDSRRLLPGSIPDASLAFVETDSCSVPQSGAEGIVQGTSPFRQGDDVDVIEEGEHSLTITKLPLQVADRVMLRQGIKGGHQGVALFAALALAHLMRAPVIVAPRVDARRRIELPSEGKERVELASGKERPEHRATRDMVKRADSIDREDGGARACFGGSAE